METTTMAERDADPSSAVFDADSSATIAGDSGAGQYANRTKRREQSSALSKRSYSRIDFGNQDDQDRGAEWRVHDVKKTGSLCRRQYDHAKQDEAETLWWWLDSHASNKAASPEFGATLLLEKDSAACDNQGEEETLVVGIVEDTSSLAAASGGQDPTFLSESFSEFEITSLQQQQHSKRYDNNETKNYPHIESWFSNQDAEASSDDRSSCDLSSLSSRSPGSSDHSSLWHKSADCLTENEEQPEPDGETRIPQVESNVVPVSWLAENEEMSLAFGETQISQADHREFAFGVGMLALWHGSGSASSSSKSASSSDDSCSSSDGDSTFGDAEVSRQPSSSISRSASVEDLDSSNGIDAVTSLSSFSAQSGVCRISSPRLIENIPVARAVPVDADEWSRMVDPTSPANPRHWSYQDFVKPKDPMQYEFGQRPCRIERDHNDARLKLRERLPILHERTETINTSQSQFVSEDAELFVKFNELEGILVDHVPRRHDFFLDLGCGASSICREMVLHGYNCVYGIDIAPQKIQFQQHQCKGLQEFVRFQEMDASKLKFPDKLFGCIFTKAVLDIVASSYVYEPLIDDNYDELQRILHEIWRCLQPGGVWIIVSCHGSRPAPAIEDANPIERTRTPWWQWKGVAEFIHRHYDRVKTYRAGIPLVQHGKRVKPFVVVVYKRKELTKQQRLTRLYRNQLEEKRSEREFAVTTQWLAEKRRFQAEEASNVHETRQMIVEDAISRFRVSDLAYATAVTAREATRAELYREILEADRVLMAAEDALATAVCAEKNAMLVFITGLLVGIAGSAVEVAVNKKKEQPPQEVVTDGKAQQPAADKNPTPTTAVATAATPQQENVKATTRNITSEDGIVSSTIVQDILSGAGSAQPEQLESTREDGQCVVDSEKSQQANDPNLSPSQEKPITNPRGESASERGFSAQEPEIPADASDNHTTTDNVLKIKGEDQLVGVTDQCAEDLNEREVPVSATGSREADVKTSEGDKSRTSGTALATLDESSSDKKPEAVSSAASVVEITDRPTVTASAANAPPPDTATESSKFNSSGVGELEVEDDSATHLQVGRDPLRTSSEDENARETTEKASLHDAAAAAQDRSQTEAKFSEQSCNGEQSGESNCTSNHQIAQPLVPHSVSAPANSHETLQIENASSSSQLAVVGACDPPSAPNTGSVSVKTEPVVEASNTGDVPTVLIPNEQNEGKEDSSSSAAFEDQIVALGDGDESVPPAFLFNGDDEAEGSTVQGNYTTTSDPKVFHDDDNHSIELSGSPQQDPNKEVASSSVNLVEGTELQPVGDGEQIDEIINKICLEVLAWIVEQISRDGQDKLGS